MIVWPSQASIYTATIWCIFIVIIKGSPPSAGGFRSSLRWYLKKYWNMERKCWKKFSEISQSKKCTFLALILQYAESDAGSDREISSPLALTDHCHQGLQEVIVNLHTTKLLLEMDSPYLPGSDSLSYMGVGSPTPIYHLAQQVCQLWETATVWEVCLEARQATQHFYHL